jgi:hypothetical protein
MSSNKIAIGVVLASVSLLAACASTETSALAESQKEAVEADIDEIMEYPVDATEVGETKRCLSEGNYRNYRALGERHLLFEGRRGKQWINVLRGRCRNLDRGDFYIMEPSSGRQLCSSDQFEVADRLTSTSFGDLGVGIKCSLGEFKPVTRAQVEEIEKRLESL